MNTTLVSSGILIFVTKKKKKKKSIETKKADIDYLMDEMISLRLQ